MTTVFNRDWDTKTNKLFLGDALGLADLINVKYPKLEELALLQRSQFWVETEVSMEQDKKQWPTLSKVHQDITLLNLSWQTMTDSFISRAPEACIKPLVSRPELEGMLRQWAYFEDLHSRAYANIIREMLPDPATFIDTVTKNEHAYARIANSVEILDELHEVGQYFLAVRDNLGQNVYPDDEYDKVTTECQEALAKTFYAVYGLEAMQFYASFACTFALAEQDVLPGVAKNLQLIAKDEAIHTVMSSEILKLMYEEFDPEVMARAKAAAPQLLRETLESEVEWAKFIFSEGRSIVGLNAELLTDYLYYVGYRAFKAVGIEWPSDLPVITRHPIPWIENWLDTAAQQVAPQEMQITNYRVGQLEGSTEESVDNFANEFGDMF